jgi:hypothetical protein
MPFVHSPMKSARNVAIKFQVKTSINEEWTNEWIQGERGRHLRAITEQPESEAGLTLYNSLATRKSVALLARHIAPSTITYTDSEFKIIHNANAVKAAKWSNITSCDAKSMSVKGTTSSKRLWWKRCRPPNYWVNQKASSIPFISSKPRDDLTKCTYKILYNALQAETHGLLLLNSGFISF